MTQAQFPITAVRCGVLDLAVVFFGRSCAPRAARALKTAERVNLQRSVGIGAACRHLFCWVGGTDILHACAYMLYSVRYYMEKSSKRLAPPRNPKDRTHQQSTQMSVNRYNSQTKHLALRAARESRHTAPISTAAVHAFSTATTHSQNAEGTALGYN